MKTAVICVLAACAFVPARAQTLRPEVVSSTLLGGVAGAVIGHNSGDLHHNGWRGAAIGAGAGLLLGSIAADANDSRYVSQAPDYPRTYVYRDAPVYYRAHYGTGWGYGHHRHHRYGGYHRPYYYGEVGYTGAFDYDDGTDRRADYRGSGLLLGALAGAVIGHNSGDLRHNAWRGAAYGAGLGYVLGSVAERNARRREAAEVQSVVTTSPAPAAAISPAPAASAPPVTRPPAATSSMSAANSLFGRE